MTGRRAGRILLTGLSIVALLSTANGFGFGSIRSAVDNAISAAEATTNGFIPSIGTNGAKCWLGKQDCGCGKEECLGPGFKYRCAFICSNSITIETPQNLMTKFVDNFTPSNLLCMLDSASGVLPLDMIEQAARKAAPLQQWVQQVLVKTIGCFSDITATGKTCDSLGRFSSCMKVIVDVCNELRDETKNVATGRLPFLNDFSNSSMFVLPNGASTFVENTFFKNLPLYNAATKLTGVQFETLTETALAATDAVTGVGRIIESVMDPRNVAKSICLNTNKSIVGAVLSDVVDNNQDEIEGTVDILMAFAEPCFENGEAEEGVGLNALDRNRTATDCSTAANNGNLPACGANTTGSTFSNAVTSAIAAFADVACSRTNTSTTICLKRTLKPKKQSGKKRPTNMNTGNPRNRRALRDMFVDDCLTVYSNGDIQMSREGGYKGDSSEYLNLLENSSIWGAEKLATFIDTNARAGYQAYCGARMVMKKNKSSEVTPYCKVGLEVELFDTIKFEASLTVSADDVERELDRVASVILTDGQKQAVRDNACQVLGYARTSVVAEQVQSALGSDSESGLSAVTGADICNQIDSIQAANNETCRSNCPGGNSSDPCQGKAYETSDNTACARRPRNCDGVKLLPYNEHDCECVEAIYMANSNTTFEGVNFTSPADCAENVAHYDENGSFTGIRIDFEKWGCYVNKDCRDARAGDSTKLQYYNSSAGRWLPAVFMTCGINFRMNFPNGSVCTRQGGGCELPVVRINEAANKARDENMTTSVDHCASALSSLGGNSGSSTVTVSAVMLPIMLMLTEWLKN